MKADTRGATVGVSGASPQSVWAPIFRKSWRKTAMRLCLRINVSRKFGLEDLDMVFGEPFLSKVMLHGGKTTGCISTFSIAMLR